MTANTCQPSRGEKFAASRLMMPRALPSLLRFCLVGSLISSSFVTSGQQLRPPQASDSPPASHHHDPTGSGPEVAVQSARAAPVQPPRIFLDKSPRIVKYQLGRLDNQRLLLVERQPDDPKYTLVYEAILTRAGMSAQHREEALAATGAVGTNGSCHGPVAHLGGHESRFASRTTDLHGIDPDVG